MTTFKAGYTRLTDLDRERERLEAKRRLAEDNGADFDQLGRIDDAIGLLQAAIAKAAVAEAEREARAGAEEAGRLEQDRPKKPGPAPRGPGDQEPDSDGDDRDEDDSGNGGGGGGGGGGAGGQLPFGAIPPAPAARGDTVEIPDGQVIYVRSEDTVWVWSRYTQTWERQDFASPILSVDTVGGGLLVVARHGACIFDAALGQWLAPLETPEVLVAGQGAGTVPGISATPATPSGETPPTPAGTDLPPIAPPAGPSGSPVPEYPLAGAAPPNPLSNPALLTTTLPAPVFPAPPPADASAPPVPGTPPGFGPPPAP